LACNTPEPGRLDVPPVTVAQLTLAGMDGHNRPGSLDLDSAKPSPPLTD
jgi:hypothetical protein